MIRKVLLGLALGWAVSCAYAQAPSPADVGISKGSPDVFKLKGSDNVWTPFGSVDPSTHIFAPVTNGSIAPNDCLKWGPGITSAGAACNSAGGGGGGGQLTIYTSHSGLVNNVTTPTEAWTVQQQGFYAPGDGGAATYQWNLTSYCAGGTSGAPTTADGIACVLPIGQAPSTAGRYLLQTPGSIDVRQVGMQAGGPDNSPYIAALMKTIGGNDVVFPAVPGQSVTGYYFSTSLFLTRQARYSCSGAFGTTTVELIFAPGVHGVVQENGKYSSDGGVGSGSVNNCLIVSLDTGTGVTTPGASTITSVGMTADPGHIKAPTTWNVGDGIMASSKSGKYQTSLLATPALAPGAYVSGVSGTTLTLGSGYTANSNLNAGDNTLAIFRLPASLKFTVQTTNGSNSVLVTGGPRLLIPGEVVWSDAFTFMSTIFAVSGTLGNQTLTMTNAFDNSIAENASVAHTSGSPGQMWVVPAGLRRDVQATSSNNSIYYWPIALEMACSTGNGLNCTGSRDVKNVYLINLFGRWVAGDNTSESASDSEFGADNFISDYMSGGSLGEVDTNFGSNSWESGSASFGPMGNCNQNNYSVALGGYWSVNTGACATASGLFPVNPGSPWLFIGPQDLVPTGTSYITSNNTGGTLFGPWFATNTDDPRNTQFCLNGGTRFIFAWSIYYQSCGGPATWALQDSGGFATLSYYNANGFNTIWFTEGDLGGYTGYTNGHFAYTDFHMGFLLYDTESLSYTPGPERLVDEGPSIPAGAFHKHGDIHFNQSAGAGGYAGWIDTADGVNFKPFGKIANDVAGTSWPVATPTTIAALNALGCSASTVGFGVVTNGVAASSANYGQTISTTGSTTRPVFCDGTSWTYH